MVSTSLSACSPAGPISLIRAGVSGAEHYSVIKTQVNKHRLTPRRFTRVQASVRTVQRNTVQDYFGGTSEHRGVRQAKDSFRDSMLISVFLPVVHTCTLDTVMHIGDLAILLGTKKGSEKMSLQSD